MPIHLIVSTLFMVEANQGIFGIYPSRIRATVLDPWLELSSATLMELKPLDSASGTPSLRINAFRPFPCDTERR